MEPFQDTSHPESTYDPADLSNLDTNTPTPRSLDISVTSSLADSDLQSCRISEEDNRVKRHCIIKLIDDKLDNPRLGFSGFLKVKVVQLTSDSYDKFQQETFNLMMRIKHRDKQQQRYQHAIDTSMAQAATYRPGLNVTPVISVSHSDTGPTATNATDIYSCTPSTSTTAAFTIFTDSLSSDIYSGICTSSTANPRPGSTCQ